MNLKMCTQILDNLHEDIIIIDPEYNIVFANKSFRKNSGQTVASKCHEACHKMDSPCKGCELSKVFKTGRQVNYQHKHYHEGKSVVCDVIMSPLKTKGKVTHVIQSTRNVSAVLKATKVAAESERKFKLLTEQTQMGIVIVQENVIKYTNQAAADIIGRSRQEMLKWKPGALFNVIHKQDRKMVMEQARKKLQGRSNVKTHYSYKIVTKHGNIKWIDNYSKTIMYEGRNAILVTIIDVTESKQAQINLVKTQEELEERVHLRTQQLLETNTDLEYANEFNQLVIDSIPDQLVVINAKTMEIIMANKATRQLVKEDVIGKSCAVLFNHGKDFQKYCPTHKTLKTGKTQRFEIDLLADNKPVHYSITTTPIRDTDKKITKVLHITRDITERKLAESALEHNRERYRRLVINAPLGIVSVSPDGVLADSNARVLQILGYKNRKEIKQFLKLDTMRVAGVADDFAVVFKTGKPIEAEKVYTTKSKQKIYLRYLLTPVRDESGKIFCVEAIMEDITKKRNAEEELRKMNKSLLALSKTSSLLQHSMDEREIVQIALDSFLSIGFDRVRFYMLDNEQLRGVRSSHLGDEEFTQVVLETGKDYPLVSKSLESGVPIIRRDERSKYTEVLDKGDVKESASLPLMGLDNPIGLISVDNKYSKREMLQDDLNLLMTFANQIAAAI